LPFSTEELTYPIPILAFPLRGKGCVVNLKLEVLNEQDCR